MIYSTEAFKSDGFTPARFETDNVLKLNGKKIPYHTVSEDNVFYDKDGKPIASIFSYSYIAIVYPAHHELAQYLE